MSYVEENQKNGAEYCSFVKKVSFMGKRFVLKEHIGKKLPTITKEGYLLANIDRITEKEFIFKKTYLDDIFSDISFHPELPYRVEKKSIELDNLLEAHNFRQILWIEFAKEFVFNSNNIEGSKIPMAKVSEIIDSGDVKYENRNEVREVENSIFAMEYVKSAFRFNKASVKRLYYILTKDLKMENGEAYPKGFKMISNIIGDSLTSEPENIEEELTTLFTRYRNLKNKIHPLILAFDLHLEYEAIHPFLDANGRTGRMIMNKVLLQNGYFPIVIFAANKRPYFNHIRSARGGAKKRFHQFMLEQAEKTYDMMLKIARNGGV